MSESTQQPLSGAERIRSLQDEDSIYHAFDSYPWKKDPMFMSGLDAILGSPGMSQGSPTDMATHARIFYYAQRIGTTIDFAAYNAWLDRHSDHQPPDILPEDHQRSAALPWQQAAPKADLFIDKSIQKPEASSTSSGLPASPSSASAGGANEPSYPLAFAEMIRLLQEGKPVPGIREIPNTIAREPTTKPASGRPAPRKPWEKNLPVEPPQLDFANTLDPDFPPVDAPAPVASADRPT